MADANDDRPVTLDKDGKNGSPSTRSRLLLLPLETRNHIYKYLLCAKHLDLPSVPLFDSKRSKGDGYDPTFPPSLAGRRCNDHVPIPDSRLGILRTNRQIYHEALQIFYQSNLFIRVLFTCTNTTFNDSRLRYTFESAIVLNPSHPRFLPRYFTQQILDVVLIRGQTPDGMMEVIVPAVYFSRLLQVLRECDMTEKKENVLYSKQVENAIFAQYSCQRGSRGSVELEPVRDMLRAPPGVVDTELYDEIAVDEEEHELWPELDTLPSSESQEVGRTISHDFDPYIWLRHQSFKLQIARKLLKDVNHGRHIADLLYPTIQSISEAGKADDNAPQAIRLRSMPLAFHTAVAKIYLEACIYMLYLKSRGDLYYRWLGDTTYNMEWLGEEAERIAGGKKGRGYVWDSCGEHPRHDGDEQTAVCGLGDNGKEGEINEDVGANDERLLGVVAYYRGLTVKDRVALGFFREADRLILQDVEVFGLKVEKALVNQAVQRAVEKEHDELAKAEG